MQNHSYRLIKNCRLCGSEHLVPRFDFGSVPLGNNLKDIQSSARNAEKFPLNVNQCTKCNHFQLGVAVNPEKLYATNYTYLSGVGKSFIEHFNNYAIWAKQRCNLSSESLVVDVGSNDGSCLKEFKDLGTNVCGVDPASAPAKIANDNGINTLVAFFDSDAVKSIKDLYGEADLVTSHNVLAHVDDLIDVFKNIYNLLKNRGFFCFEIGYFREVLKNNFFDTIYHEHLDYHHAKPLADFLTKLGFNIIDLSVNDIQGGTLRLLLQKTGEGKISEQAESFLVNESESVLYDNNFIKNWQHNIETNMISFGDRVKTYVSNNYTVVGYGAPTKATLLTEISQLTSSHISFIVEDNQLKLDKYMPSSGIPILNVSEIKNTRPDVIVIFAWNFSEDIINKLKDYIDWPILILVPLPELYEKKL